MPSFGAPPPLPCVWEEGSCWWFARLGIPIVDLPHPTLKANQPLLEHSLYCFNVAHVFSIVSVLCIVCANLYNSGFVILIPFNKYSWYHHASSSSQSIGRKKMPRGTYDIAWLNHTWPTLPIFNLLPCLLQYDLNYPYPAARCSVRWWCVLVNQTICGKWWNAKQCLAQTLDTQCLQNHPTKFDSG